MEPLSILTALALVVEFATQAVKEAVPYIKGKYSRLLSILLGMGICIATRQGILHLFSIPVAIPVIDYLVTGILISRGSNLLHDLFSKLNT